MIISVNWSKLPESTSIHAHTPCNINEFAGAWNLFNFPMLLKKNPSRAMA